MRAANPINMILFEVAMSPELNETQTPDNVASVSLQRLDIGTRIPVVATNQNQV